MSEWYLEEGPAPDEEQRQTAQQHQDNLTKPKGSLGRLEEVAIQLSALQGTPRPAVNRPLIAVFAGDHGVTAEGVSAYPQTVTAEMVRNFASGGAAISVLARSMGVPFQVVNVGTVYAIEDLDNVQDRRVAAGTQNTCGTEAMTLEQCHEGLIDQRDLSDHYGDGTHLLW